MKCVGIIDYDGLFFVVFAANDKLWGTIMHTFLERLLENVESGEMHYQL